MTPALVKRARDRFARWRNPFLVFLTPEALAINAARQDHLASIGLPIVGLRLLEVGAGIGLHTEFFLARGCSVRATEGRAENVTEMKRRYPSREIAELDLEEPDAILAQGQFDGVYCYGTLYHLATPFATLQALSRISALILLETCCSPGLDDEVVYVDEQAGVVNQAQSGCGCRPSRRWVLARLRELWGHGYISTMQPSHPDFPTNWETASTSWEPRMNSRAIFVGSRTPLALETLSETPLQTQQAI